MAAPLTRCTAAVKAFAVTAFAACTLSTPCTHRALRRVTVCVLQVSESSRRAMETFAAVASKFAGVAPFVGLDWFDNPPVSSMGVQPRAPHLAILEAEMQRAVEGAEGRTLNPVPGRIWL